MVSKAYYVDDEHSNRRSSNRGFGYPLMHERMLPRTSEGGGSRSFLPPSESKGIDQGSDQDVQPRRRIPVACGRCRKRKIRCSGNPGNGGSCENCRLANIDTCAFLRVSSTETPLRGEAPDFAYDPASSRAHCRIPMGGGCPQGYQQISPLSADSISAYRQGSISGYSIPMRGMYHSPPAYNQYSEGHIDYGMHAIPSMPDCHHGQGGRSWASSGRLPNGMLYSGLDNSQYHSQVQYHADTYAVRPVDNQEHKTYSINNIISPISSNGSDRLLPVPTQRPSPVDSFVRGDSSAQGSVPGSAQSSFSGLMGANMRTMNALSISDNQAIQHHQPSYIAQSGSNGSEIDQRSPLTYSNPGHSVPMSQHQDSGHWVHDGIYPPSNSSTDLYYTPSSSASRKYSEASQPSNDASLPSLSSHANVHTYAPLPVQPLQSHLTYSQPPMDPQSNNMCRTDGVPAM